MIRIIPSRIYRFERLGIEHLASQRSAQHERFELIVTSEDLTTVAFNDENNREVPLPLSYQSRGSCREESREARNSISVSDRSLSRVYGGRT